MSMAGTRNKQCPSRVSDSPLARSGAPHWKAPATDYSWLERLPPRQPRGYGFSSRGCLSRAITRERRAVRLAAAFAEQPQVEKIENKLR